MTASHDHAPENRAAQIRAEVFAESAVAMERRQRAYMITGTSAIARDGEEPREVISRQIPKVWDAGMGIPQYHPVAIAARTAAKHERDSRIETLRVPSREPCSGCGVREDRHAEAGCRKFRP